MPTNDIALICGDGAIKGGFVAGAVNALQDMFPDVMSNLSVVAATSASVGSMFYFLSHGRDHTGLEIWTKELASKEFMDFRGARSFFSSSPLYDIDFMADVVAKERNPLNIERVLSHETEFYVSVQRYDDGRLEYFANREATSFIRNGSKVPVHAMGTVDPYELIKASMSAPFVFDKAVNLNGTEYLDAGTLEPFILDLPALKGKKRIVIITRSKHRVSKSLDYKLSGYLWPMLVTPFKSRKFRSDIYRQYARKPDAMRRLIGELETLEKYDRTVVISPEFRLGSITDNEAQTLEKNFKHGVEVVEKLAERISEVVQM